MFRFIERNSAFNRGCVQKYKVIANVLPWVSVPNDERTEDLLYFGMNYNPHILNINLCFSLKKEINE